MAEKAEKLSVLEQLKKLDEQRATILATAKTEALEKANAAVEELNALGFTYSLTEGTAKGKKAATRQKSEGPCSVCGFETDPPHSGRNHRSQPKNAKKAFTAKELEERGMKKKT